MSEEDFKGGVHAGAGMLFAVMAAYSLMRWCSAKQPRNAVNVLVYTPLLIWEWRQAWYHWSRSSRCLPSA